MNKQKTANSLINKKIKSTVISVLIGETVTVVLLFLFALLILKVNLPHSLADALVVVSAVIGSLIAGIFNGKIINEKGLFYGALAGFIITIVILIINTAFFHLTFTMISIVKYILIITAAAVGGVIGVNLKIHR